MIYAYVLTGETFQHKEAIKASGWFRWDTGERVWVRKIDESSIKENTSVLKFAKGLPGVSVIEMPAAKYKILEGKLYW